MKIAILADIHSNLEGLNAVAEHIEQWKPDAVMVLGDVVNRGPKPVECLQFVIHRQTEKGWLLLRGNHEDYVMCHATQKFSGVEAELFQNSFWTYETLGRNMTPLESWPFSMGFGLPGGELRIAHASMRHDRDGIYTDTTDETLRLQIGKVPPTVFCVGHTHKPLMRQIDHTLVVNVGSAGLPFDGDPRVSYAQLERLNSAWKAEIVRVDYDRAAADRHFDDSGFIDDGGAMARLIRVELRVARSQIAEWSHIYEKAVRDGEISLDDSVTKFLSEEGLKEKM
jgi:predicted phosphodiesterase